MTVSEFTTPTAAKPECTRLHLGTAPIPGASGSPTTPSSRTGRRSSTRSSSPGSAPSSSAPFGYLPTHPERLQDELGKRGLTLTAGTVGTATHRGADAFEQSRRDAFAVCELLAAMDVHHLVTLPEMYTDLHTGTLTQPAQLTAEQWRDLSRRPVATPATRQAALRCSAGLSPPRRHPRRHPGVHRQVPRRHRHRPRHRLALLGHRSRRILSQRQP